MQGYGYQQGACRGVFEEKEVETKMRYYRFLVLAIASLLYCNLGFAYDWAEVDGLRYEYIEYEQGYRLVSIVGYSSDIPENLSIPS